MCARDLRKSGQWARRLLFVSARLASLLSGTWCQERGRHSSAPGRRLLCGTRRWSTPPQGGSAGYCRLLGERSETPKTSPSTLTGLLGRSCRRPRTSQPGLGCGLGRRQHRVPRPARAPQEQGAPRAEEDLHRCRRAHLAASARRPCSRLGRHRLPRTPRHVQFSSWCTSRPPWSLSSISCRAC